MSGRTSVHLAVLTAFCLVVLFVGLGSRALWDNDEGMHAAMSRDMLRTGDWVVPRFAGEPFLDKPPLFTWMVAGSFALLGPNEFAARFPTALLGLALALSTYLLGRRTVGETGAFLGGVFLAGSVMFLVLSHAVVHDMALALPVSVALLLFFAAHDRGEGSARVWIPFWIAVGFSVLAKGPLGAVLIAGPVSIHLILRRDLRFLMRMAPLPGIAVALLIAFPWYVAMEIRQPGFLRYFLLTQNFGNFAGVGPRHPEPWWFYLPVLILGFLPWSHLLPAALGRAFRKPSDLGAGTTFLLTWFLFGFVLFSVASSKLPSYLLPLVPAVALLVGSYAARFVGGDDGGRRRVWAVGHASFVALVLGGTPFLWRLATRHPYYDAAHHRTILLVFLGLLAGTAVLSTLLLAAGRRGAHVASIAIGFASALAFLSMALGPALDASRSTKDIALWLDRTRPAGEPLVFYSVAKDSALFYATRPAVVLRDRAALVGFLRTTGTPCTIMTRDLEELGALDAPYEVVRRGGNKTVIAGKGVE